MGVAASSVSSLAQVDRFQKLGVVMDPWADAQVLFWKKIYTEYSTRDWVIHDTVNLGHVYGVEGSERAAANKKREVKALLLKIFRENSSNATVKTEALSPEELKLYQTLDANEDPRTYQFAADSDRIRTQLGQKDRLENAYLISRHYITRMEEMLEEEGVPKEISRLPFVESSFNQNARSSVGAIGIWQFMPKTAMRDLRVDSAIDERYDPLKSTRAAARFLKSNERILNNWSLAIMAYHHGPGLVLKATQKLKTKDPLQIIRHFKNPQYQFASRNYLFEFLAMCDVDSQHELFFKKTEERELPAFITVGFPTRLRMKEILGHYKLNESAQKLLNPHFRPPIWTNHASIPAHYPVRLTGITLEEFRKLEYPKSQ